MLESEIRRFLDPITFNLWLEIQLQDDLRRAKINDLEYCPICKYAICVGYTIPQTGAYRCTKCYRTTCRICKEIDHLPFQCYKASQLASSSTSNIHKVNENMSKALMRICPNSNCGTPIIKLEKDGGCNKIVCTKCGSSMCYVCRKQLYGKSYEHFGGANDNKGKKCPMYDDTASKHLEEVELARFEAQATGPSDNDDLEYV